MSISRNFGLLLALTATAACSAIVLVAATPPPPSEHRTIGPDSRTDEEYERALEANGWTRKAAWAVVANQADFWRVLDENGPEEVDDVLGRLYARLGGHDRWLRALESRPDYAGLLAGLLDVDARGPDIFLDALDGVSGHEAAAASLFQFGPRPEEVLRTARLLKEEGTLILRLVERSAPRLIGLLQPEALPRDVDARRTYRLWTRRLIERGLSSPDDRFDKIQTILTIHASTVADRLDRCPDFRRRFNDEIAPLAESILLKEGGDDLDWGVRAGTPALWGYLQEYGAQGREWFESHGAVATDLLTASGYRDVRPKIVEAVRFGDEATIAALLDEDLRGRTPFVKLLGRDLPPGTLATALANLQADPLKAPNILSYYDQLSNAALIKDLGPPPSGPVTWLPGYAVYELADKIRDGRGVGMGDVAFAALDAFEAVTMLKGGKLGLEAIQAAVEKGTNPGLKAIQATVKHGMERRGASAAAGQAARATKRQLMPWVLKETAAGTRVVMNEAMERASRAMTIDVTQVVQLVFQGSGVGRETFKNLTRLEARVFMRQDRRVFIDLASAGARDHALGRYLRMTAANGGVIEGAGAALDTAPGRAAVRRADAWRKHVGAWWLAHATRSIDSLGAPRAVAVP